MCCLARDSRTKRHGDGRDNFKILNLCCTIFLLGSWNFVINFKLCYLFFMSLQHYRVCVKEYIARGRDGYATLRDCPTIVTAKNGPVLSTTVQNYFEGIVRPCKSRGCLHRCVTFDRRRSSSGSRANLYYIKRVSCQELFQSVS